MVGRPGASRGNNLDSVAFINYALIIIIIFQDKILIIEGVILKFYPKVSIYFNLQEFMSFCNCSYLQ